MNRNLAGQVQKTDYSTGKTCTTTPSRRLQIEFFGVWKKSVIQIHVARSLDKVWDYFYLSEQIYLNYDKRSKWK